MTEYEIHKSVVENLKARAMPGTVWFHPANGGARDGRQAKNLQRMGVQPGVADLILLHNGEAFALELKAPKGHRTDSQISFAERWIQAGANYYCAYNLDEALLALNSWGLIR